MTIVTTSTKAVGQGNSANVTWPYTFLIPAQADVIVTLVDVTSGNPTVIPPSNYTITGLGDPIGGAVTYPLSGSPLTVATFLVVERFVPDVQETDFTLQGAVYPTDIEDALDYLTMITQQQQDQLDRSIIFSVADSAPVTTLPPAAARAGLVLGFDSVGDPIAVDGITSGTTVSAAMIPVVTAPTTDAALTALGLPGALLALLIPSGVEWAYNAAGSAPTGFVFPIGQPCTSAFPDYRAKLISAGSPYGTNGVDPLMPDRRGSVAAGKSNMGGVDNGLLPGGTVLGAVLGSSTKTLITANLPAYTPAASNISAVTSITNTQQNFSLTAGGTGVIVNVVANTTSIPIVGTAQGGTSTAFSIIQLTFVCNIILKVH